MFRNLFDLISNKPNKHTAIISEEETINYGDLKKRVLSFIPFIKQYRNQKKIIAIACGKNVDFIAWELATSLNKNIFLPMNDSKEPQTRFLNILESAQPEILILSNGANQKQQDKFPNYRFVQNFTSSSLWMRKTPSKRKFNLKGADYLIYSSGSTGEPKGILLSNKGIINVAREQSKIFNISKNSICGWLLNPSFDASLSDIYTALYRGATLCIIDQPIIKIKNIINIINQNKITHLDIPPTLLSIIRPNLLPHLKTIIFGGELADTSTVRLWLSAGKTLYNAYGPTEACICSGIKKVDCLWESNNTGRPLKGYRYFISQNKELLISTGNLAIGYIDKKLTKEKFIIKNYRRWYRTGDMVDLVNGEYHYRGRLDRQFKFNGVLICPEEIEVFAKSNGLIQARCFLENDKIKLNYVGETDIGTFKEKLNNHFPSNMRPHIYQKLNTVSLNASGKTNL